MQEKENNDAQLNNLLDASAKKFHKMGKKLFERPHLEQICFDAFTVT